MSAIEQLELPTESCKQAIDSVIKTELGTVKYTCVITAGSAKGDNYTGIVYRAHAKSTTKTVENKKDEMSIIVKHAPLNPIRRDQFFVRPIFEREFLMYEELLPLYIKFQESKGIVPSKDGFFEVPKCYRVIKADLEEALIFQDLKAEGFEMFDRFKEVTYEHVKLVMQVLGKFHAISFALKDQCPKAIEPYKNMQEIFTQREFDKGLNDWFNSNIDRALKTLDPIKDKVILERLKQVMSKTYMELIKVVIDGKAAEPYACVNHGDCWNNNMLFKNSNGKPVDIRLLDWQISRYASPVLDVLYYIFGCTTKQLRDDHYEDFIKIYHSSLSEFLTRLGSDPTKLFPYTALQAQLKQFGIFGILMAMLVLPFFTSEGDDIPDLDEWSMKLQNGEDISKPMENLDSEAKYNKRMSDVIRDIYRLDYL